MLHKLWIWLFQGPWQRIEDFFKRCYRKWNIYNMNWTTSCCTGEERGELPGTEIFLASLGQVFVQYSQNWSAVVLRLLILWLSNLKVEGRLALLDLWFIRDNLILWKSHFAKRKLCVSLFLYFLCFDFMKKSSIPGCMEQISFWSSCSPCLS